MLLTKRLLFREHRALKKKQLESGGGRKKNKPETSMY